LKTFSRSSWRRRYKRRENSRGLPRKTPSKKAKEAIVREGVENQPCQLFMRSTEKSSIEKAEAAIV
jgi:hypothetical protein